jgi:hypothetical protein
MDLLAFLEAPLTAHKINNRMVRHLSFDLQKDPEAQELFLSTDSIKVVRQWIKTPKKITTKQRLNRAQKALDDCTWFGIQEKFKESMQLFAFTFNRPPVKHTPHINAYKPSQDIDNYCKELIANQNEDDLILYQYGLNIFNKKFDDMSLQLRQQYSDCNLSIDEMLDMHYKNSKHSIAADDIQYDFGMELLVNGWHRRELTQPETTYFRWTNNKQSVIDFWTESKDYQLTIRIINAVSLEHLNQLDIHINNISIPYEYDQNQGVVRIITAHVTQSMIKNNLLRIQFIQPETLCHKDIFDSDDNRNLGIAVNWIKITACQK